LWDKIDSSSQEAWIRVGALLHFFSFSQSQDVNLQNNIQVGTSHFHSNRLTYKNLYDAKDRGNKPYGNDTTSISFFVSWETDTVLIIQDVLAISGIGLAAIFVSTIAALILILWQIVDSSVRELEEADEHKRKRSSAKKSSHSATTMA